MNRMRVLLGLSMIATLSACGGDDVASSATAADETSNSSETEADSANTADESGTDGSCEQGTENCDCYGNGTCNEGLECVDGTCVDGSTDSSTSGDGDSTSSGDGDSSSGGDGDSSSGGDGDSSSGGDGDSGTSGGDGDSGTSGGDGDSSTSGGDGDSGTSGGDGDSGTSGGDGDSGTSGGDGDSGTSGGDGDSGTSGGDGDGGGSGGACTTPFEKQCNGDDNVETCSAGYEWEVTSICPDTCLNGQCVSGSTCIADSWRCNGLLVEQCNSQGTGWIVQDVCSYGCDSSNFVCTDQCSEGEMRCAGSLAQTCDNGGAWQTTEDCGSNSCHDGVCSESDIYVIGEDLEWCGDIWVDGTVSITASSTITVGSCGYLTIHADEIILDQTSAIVADELLCDARGKGGNAGTSGTYYYRNGGAGGGHSVKGGNGYTYYSTAQGGPPYGSATELTADSGACGGNAYQRSGGVGGGYVELYAHSSLDVDGTITADGANGSAVSASYGGSGGGSGGSIVLYSGLVSVGSTAVLSAAGGIGGQSNYDGGNGAAGRVKILYGNELTSLVDPGATISGQYTESVAPPWVLSSSTHPDEDAWYNDGFNTASFAWQRPSDYQVDGYYRRFNQNAYSVPTAAQGTFTNAESHNEPYDPSWNNDQNYFHLVTQDASEHTIGILEHNYRIQVNSNPPNVSSSSHASESSFYASPDVSLSWTDPHASENYTDYVYIWDRFANTVPTPTFGTHQQIQSIFQPGTPDGIWYLHVISIDTMGYPTREADHFKVNVGSEPGTGNIAGTVKDSVTDANIDGATIVVNGGIWSTTSSGGTYSFGSNSVYETEVSGWPVWEVLVTAPGYEPATAQVTVQADSTTAQNFVLTATP